MDKSKIPLILAILVILILVVSMLPESSTNHNSSNNVTYMQSSTGKNLVIINFDYSVDPGAVDMFNSALSGLNSTNTAGVVIEMNTQGGLIDSMLTIIDDINHTESLGIPVFTYITTNGFGAYAGAYIAMASTQVWMARGSVIGPATPSEDASDFQSLMISLAQEHNHNATAASLMVTNGATYSYSSATLNGLINGNTTSFNNFLARINMAGYHQDTISESYFDQFVSFISNATVDGLLISFGSLAILLDLYHRTIFMTLLGLGLIILGFLGSQLIDASVVGLVFLVMGSILIFLEFKTGHGIALMAGVAVDIIGTLFLVSPQYDLTAQPYSSGYSPSPINESFIITAVLVLLIAAFIAYYINRIVRSQVRKPVTGWESMIGSEGTADTDIDPEGWISLEGVRWKARTETNERIEKGEHVVVIGINNLTLVVKKVVDSGRTGI